LIKDSTPTIKTGNSHLFKAICQIKSRLIHLNLLKEMTSPLAQTPAPTNFGGLLQNIPNAVGGLRSNTSSPPVSTNNLGLLQGLRGFNPDKK